MVRGGLDLASVCMVLVVVAGTAGGKIIVDVAGEAAAGAVVSTSA